MKNKLLHFCCLGLCSVIIIMMVACGADIGGGGSDDVDDGGDDTSTTITVPDLYNGYTYTKENDDGVMQFSSSDSDLDEFINEYMERHLRYSDNSIGSLKIGEGSTVWKEWEAMSVMWMDTSGIGYSPKNTIGNWFSSIYQDGFGYIWMDNGTTTGDWGQSWQFPNMGHSGNGSSGVYYNTSYLNGENNLTGYNGSNELSCLWSGYSDNGEIGTLNLADTGYYDSLVISANDMKSITYIFESPTDGSVKPFMGTPYCSPFLELDFTLTDFDSLGTTEQVEDVIVYWKGGSGDKNDDWDTEHMVRYSEFSSNYVEEFSTTTHIVFPMYANENWGTSKSVDDAITDMKIEVIFKNGINAEVRLEEVTLAFDGRQVNNNSLFIAAAAYYFQYTQDTEWLSANLTKIRKAMQFLLTYCKGGEQALITVENFIGHDGSSNYDYYKWTDEDGLYGYYTNTGIGSGIGDGYWDCLSCPTVSLYCNMYYYKALKGMEYLEKMVTAAGIESNDTVEVWDSTMSTKEEYTETAESLAILEDVFVSEFQDYFWNDQTGRFHLGYLSEDDAGVQAGVLSTTVDYGFTTFNEECIELGLATADQEEQIMSWINGERTVESDTANNSSKSKQIYYYSFAPRWSTSENIYQYWYRFNGATSGSYGWNKQVQNGGTALHCAYYDLVAENIVNGADAAYSKLENIESWYNTVKAAGGSGYNFYRAYYTANGVILQGGDSSGVLGMDYEFIEAEILVTAIPTAFFGLGSVDYNVLSITPNLPTSLSWWKMENLSYADLTYDLTIGDDWVQINSVQGDTSGKQVCVTLQAPSGSFTVRQHNTILTEGTDYVVEDGQVIITVPFQNGRIQIVQ